MKGVLKMKATYNYKGQNAPIPAIGQGKTAVMFSWLDKRRIWHFIATYDYQTRLAVMNWLRTSDEVVEWR